MSWNSISLHNPDIDKGTQLARREAEGLKDIYFRHTSDGKGKETYETVDLTDEVTRRVDARTLPLDPIDEHDRYKEVNGKNYIVGYQDVGYGKHVPYLREVLGRNYYSDTKMALIGGKVYEIEFETDPETKRISTYLTTSVGDLFQNDKFLADQTPTQKLELLGKIRKSATYITWYDSGEYNRCQREKESGGPVELDPAKVKNYNFDDGALALYRDLEKKADVPAPANEPIPSHIKEVGIAIVSGGYLGLGLSLYSGGFAAGKARGGTGSSASVPEATQAHAPAKLYRRTGSRNSQSHYRRYN